MKRKIIALILSVIMLTAFAIPVLADDPSGMDVDIDVVSGGDIDVGIDLNAGGNIDVSVNGEGLATDGDIAGIWAGLGGTSGMGGPASYGSPEVHYYIYWNYIVPMRADIANIYSGLDLTIDGLAKLILEISAQEDWLGELEEEQMEQYEVLSNEMVISKADYQRLITEAESMGRTQLEAEHQIVMDYLAYRIAVMEWQYNIWLGILGFIVLLLASGLIVCIIKLRN